MRQCDICGHTSPFQICYTCRRFSERHREANSLAVMLLVAAILVCLGAFFGVSAYEATKSGF